MTRTHLQPLELTAVMALYHHRLMSTVQLAQLLCPEATTTSWTRTILARLRQRGLVDSVGSNHSRVRMWFVTDDGAQAAEGTRMVISRPYRMTGQTAQSQIQKHTLDVVDTGLVFYRTARRYHDTCGAFDWIPEVGHPYRHGNRYASLVIDAVLNYTLIRSDARRRLTYAIELDRATMSLERLVQKIISYVHWYRTPGQNNRPAWSQKYPTFPRILVVLSGARDHLLEGRAEDLRTALAQHSEVLAHRSEIHAAVTTLRALQQEGPASSIMYPLFWPDAAPRLLFTAPTVAAA